MSEDMIDQQIDAAVEQWHATKTNMGMALGSFATVSLATHSLGGLFFGTCAAYVAARHGDAIASSVRNAIPQEVIDYIQRRKSQPKSGNLEEDVQAVDAVTEALPVASLPEMAESLFDFGVEDDMPPTRQRAKGDVFRFSELLDAGFVPTIKKIFVGRTMDGKDIFVAAEDLCHVALAGRTGGGKGSLMRLIMAQLCCIGTRVLLLNPHYMRWVVAKDGPSFDEDWTPFEGTNARTGRSYLEVPPVDCADFTSIEQYLIDIIENILRRRTRDAREGGKKFKPYFIVLDEWPILAKKIKDGPDYLADLLREGRKFGVFVVVASQDFQVKTIGMDGGSVRQCLLTTYYTGGDKTTAKELLNMSIAEVNEIENKLGKGVVLLKCVGTRNEPVLVQVPFVDNESVYRLLGPSTFKVAKQEDMQSVSTMPVTNLEEQQVTLSYAQLTAMMQQQNVTNILPVQQETAVLPEIEEELPANVIRSPYYEQSSDVVAYPPTRRSSSALPDTLQKAKDAYEPGMSYRELGAKLGIGKDAAGKRIEELKRRKLV